MHRRRFGTVFTVVAAVGLSMLGGALPAQATPTPTPSRTPLPAVYPVPRSMTAHGPGVLLGNAVGLVTGPASDPDAIAEVRQVVAGAGVRTIDQVADPTTLSPGETAIFVGGADENPPAGPALAALGVPDASALAAEGYVLADGIANGRPVLVLDGKDATGTYYAAQTLRQLVVRHGPLATVPGVRVRDWPTYPIRGVIEGFYGTPWSDAQRMDQFDFYGAHKMNTYVYSPKNDPYLRDQWRDPYPAAQLAALKALVDRADANHVTFTYALSPGLSVCYSSASDEQALVAKFQSLWDIGVRSFAIPLDDISYTTWNCTADATKFGTGGAAAGAAQSYLLNEVQKDFIATHPGSARLEMVPTEYADVAASPYKDTIKAQLDPAVVVEWTGVGVIAPVITPAQAAAAKAVYGHDILVWDNYPVNDYVTNRLLLGPYVGRSPGLTGSLIGITANPMIEPDASKIALFNVADYTWNDAAYDPSASWQASLREFAGSDPQARASLNAFADLEYYSQIDPTQAPALAERIASFWSAWESGDQNAAGRLDGYLQLIQNVPTVLSTKLPNATEFAAETQPWLDSAGTWGQAARAALTMLSDERAGNGAAAAADRAQAKALMAKAGGFTYVGLNGTVNVTVGDGVLDAFIDDALTENERWLGLAGRHVTAMTSMSPYQSNTPDKMVDGDDATYFWSSAPPNPGDYVGVDLGAVEPISHISIHMSKPTSPDDYIHSGVLEYSSDNANWTTVGSFSNTTDIEADVAAGTQARFVRFRDTLTQANWVVVREFTVTSPATAPPTVTGTPAPATGSSVAAAADGAPDTSYVAANAPAAGDALNVALPKARPVQRVLVVGTGSATVAVHDANGWHDIGALRPGYTDLPANNATIDTIRLQWTAGGAAPSIAEVIPWYADVPTATMTLAAPSVDVQVGTSATVNAYLTATEPADVPGLLSASAPSGVTVRPAASGLILPRGSQQTDALTVRGTTPGSYQVPITFRAPGATAVTATLTVRVHPAVSTTNVALAGNGTVATASSVEQSLPQFTPDHAIDGDPTTRWSSNYTDGEWLQLAFATPQTIGKVVLQWEAAHATAYQIQTSTDGQTWTTAATVTNSPGGTETVWLDAPTAAKYLRMQGVSRATQYGYSIYEFQAYPVAQA
ncbi:MAG TPA: beta-N-acetylglucosaminidase domain-containing protein [Pseudonocardiaceae bacterium]|jgi:hyaluronoglucosaminidase|nr:beta-N-acetylglucosaminidase domain-containing protein [Pseudonocardiaceae bacterium]